jgi:hypothetical protein
VRDHIALTFLSGSYRRATLIEPAKGKRADVDVVVLTRFNHHESSPDAVLDLFHRFANRAYEGHGQVKRQGRSVGIDLEHVALDIVPAASQQIGSTVLDDVFSKSDSSALDAADDTQALVEASTSQAWRKGPLFIPDREAKEWCPTHPLEQLAWTVRKNRETDGRFVNVVKIFKHWRRAALALRDRPRGFPLERLVGDCYQINAPGLAEGITQVFSQFVGRYGVAVQAGRVPVLKDYGVPSRNVMARVAPEDFRALYEAVQQAHQAADAALRCEDVTESVRLWRSIFGDRFPAPPPQADHRGGGFVPPPRPSKPSTTGLFG